MAIYYVSKQRGLDTNDGLSPSTPWATITKAVQTLVAGDTVYIGSGTYREILVNPNAGINISSIILFQGDPDSRYVIGDNPGIIRVTGASEAEIQATTGYTWACSRNWVTLSTVHVDGASGISRSLHTSGQNNIDCVVYGKSIAILRGFNIRCVASAGATAFSSSIAEYCIALSGQSGFFLTGTTSHSNIAIGCDQGFTGDPVTINNCIAIGCRAGFSAQYCHYYNCIAFACFWGFYNACQPYNCLAALCNTGYFSAGAIVNSRHVMCATVGASTGVTEGSVFLLASMLNKEYILKAFDPWISLGAAQSANDSRVAGTVDILGRARRMLGGVLDVGPYAFSNIAPNYTTVKAAEPSICISRAGQQLMEVPAKANEAIAVKWWVNIEHTTTMPQVILRGASITEQTTTYSGSGWQQLTVTATPTADEILTCVLYARDTGATAKSYFADYEVT